MKSQVATMDRNKLLLVSCFFPPVGGVQVQRALNLARYLSEEGFNLHVLTVKNPSVPTLDPGLLQRVPESVKIHRTRTMEPPFHLRKRLWSRVGPPQLTGETKPARQSSVFKKGISALVERILSPDPQVLWYPTAIRKAEHLIRDEGIGTVLVTAPPFSAFFIGNHLKKLFPSLTLISDFRDEWLEYFVKQYHFRGSAFSAGRAAQIERATIEHSDCVVAAAPAARAMMRARYPDQPGQKFKTIPNGYDQEQFSSFRARAHSGGKILVLHLGTVYENMSPVPYLDALDRLPPEMACRFETRFIGRVAEEFDVRLLTIRNSEVSILPFVPHQEAIRQMEEADILLTVCHDSVSIPGKLYDYMGTRKPVLALAKPGGDIDRLIKRTKCGWCVDPTDVGGMIDLLTRLALEPSARTTTPDEKAISEYARKKLVAAYANLIRETQGAQDVVSAH